MSHRVESFRKVNRRKNRPSDRLGFAKSIGNGLRKIHNLIEGRPSRVETSVVETLGGRR